MIKLENITKIYNKGKNNEFLALDQVSFKIDSGELVSIIGKSGAGKSTLLHILACIDSYDNGEYYIDETLVKNLSDEARAAIRNQSIGIVMQDYALVEDFSVIENVLLPLDFDKHKKKNRREIAIKVLEDVDMKEYEKKKVNCLSGGQKQRVAIARAIVNNPSIILADEPTGALDSKNAEQIMKLLKKLNTEGKTIIIVTHDKGISEQCDRVIEIIDGKI